jgi:hypothetical protein
MDVEGEVAAEADAVAANNQDQPVQHVEEGERTKLKVLLRAKKDQRKEKKKWGTKFNFFS